MLSPIAEGGPMEVRRKDKAYSQKGMGFCFSLLPPYTLRLTVQNSIFAL